MFGTGMNNLCFVNPSETQAAEIHDIAHVNQLPDRKVRTQHSSQLEVGMPYLGWCQEERGSLSAHVTLSFDITDLRLEWFVVRPPRICLSSSFWGPEAINNQVRGFKTGPCCSVVMQIFTFLQLAESVAAAHCRPT
eukprot:3967507-Amphidinium_carterae.2